MTNSAPKSQRKRKAEPNEQSPAETASDTPPMAERQGNEAAVQPAMVSETPAPAPVQQDAAPVQRTTVGEAPTAQLAATSETLGASEDHPSQTRQKDKDQQDKARKVDALLTDQVFGDKIGLFQKWRDQWSTETEGYRRERAEVEGQMFDASPRMRSKGKKGAKDSPAKAKKRQELRARLNRLDKDRPPDDPWEQVREVANHGSDDHEHNLMAYMFPAKLEPPESESHIRCLQYVRLGILRDMALRGDAGVRPITYGVLDAGEVEATWNDMDRNWWVGWADAIGTAITAVEADLRSRTQVAAGMSEPPAKRKADAASQGQGTTTGQTVEPPAGLPAQEGEGTKIGEKVHIDLRQWNKGPSRDLMQDLLDDRNRHGVVLEHKRHGKQQPQSLKDVLTEKGLDEIKEAIVKVKGKRRTYKLTIPWERIEYDSPKT